PSAPVSAATSTVTKAARSSRAAATCRGRTGSRTAAERRRPGPARAYACAATSPVLARPTFRPLRPLLALSPLQLTGDLALGVGERRLGLLAPKQHVLQLRPERLFHLAVVAEAPVADHLVGMLELRLEDGVDERVAFLERRKVGGIDGAIAGNELTVDAELLRALVGDKLQELPGQVGILRGFRDTKAV